MIEGAGQGGLPVPERLARYTWAAAAVRGSVLDAGCGAGAGSALLAARAEAVVGVDLSPAAIAAARREHGERAEFRLGDLRELPFDAARFDSAVCFEALTHTEDPGRAIDELRRVLRPGGLLLASAPNREAYPAGNPLQLSELSPAELGELLGRRFSHVAIYRQQPYLASLLCDDALLAAEGPGARIDVRVAKAAGGEPGSELHAVAAASDGELPAAPAELALGGDADRAEQRRLLDEWRRRAIEAEAEAEALRRELRAAQS